MSHDAASVFEQNDRLNRSIQDLNKGGRCDVHRVGSPASTKQVQLSVIGKTLTSVIFIHSTVWISGETRKATMICIIIIIIPDAFRISYDFGHPRSRGDTTLRYLRKSSTALTTALG